MRKNRVKTLASEETRKKDPLGENVSVKFGFPISEPYGDIRYGERQIDTVLEFTRILTLVRETVKKQQQTRIYIL